MSAFAATAAGVRAGREVEHPMAVVIVGGLASSTALSRFQVLAL